jgi:transcriptional regulator with XRE-family HTH domain
MSVAKTPGEIFKEARLKKGWTQEEVTKRAGLGKNTYPKIERGVNKPDSNSALKLAEVLGIKLSSEIIKILLRR